MKQITKLLRREIEREWRKRSDRWKEKLGIVQILGIPASPLYPPSPLAHFVPFHAHPKTNQPTMSGFNQNCICVSSTVVLTAPVKIPTDSLYIYFPFHLYFRTSPPSPSFFSFKSTLSREMFSPTQGGFCNQILE